MLAQPAMYFPLVSHGHQQHHPTGVIAEATLDADSKSTSPQIVPSSNRLIPTSITTAPSLSHFLEPFWDPNYRNNNICHCQMSF